LPEDPEKTMSVEELEAELERTRAEHSGDPVFVGDDRDFHPLHARYVAPYVRYTATTNTTFTIFQPTEQHIWRGLVPLATPTPYY
jgi:hypothetical protein